VPSWGTGYGKKPAHAMLIIDGKKILITREAQSISTYCIYELAGEVHPVLDTVKRKSIKRYRG
jgi:hypothetical protein